MLVQVQQPLAIILHDKPLGNLWFMIFFHEKIYPSSEKKCHEPTKGCLKTCKFVNHCSGMKKTVELFFVLILTDVYTPRN